MITKKSAVQTLALSFFKMTSWKIMMISLEIWTKNAKINSV